MTAICAFGDDVDQVAKKGYLSLRRRKQFAMIQPSGAGRIDVGLILKDVPAGGRLESAAGFNAAFTAAVPLVPARGSGPRLLCCVGARNGIKDREHLPSTFVPAEILRALQSARNHFIAQ